MMIMGRHKSENTRLEERRLRAPRQQSAGRRKTSSTSAEIINGISVKVGLQWAILATPTYNSGKRNNIRLQPRSNSVLVPVFANLPLLEAFGALRIRTLLRLALFWPSDCPEATHNITSGSRTYADGTATSRRPAASCAGVPAIVHCVQPKMQAIAIHTQDKEIGVPPTSGLVAPVRFCVSAVLASTEVASAPRFRYAQNRQQLQAQEGERVEMWQQKRFEKHRGR